MHVCGRKEKDRRKDEVTVNWAKEKVKGGAAGRGRAGQDGAGWGGAWV